MTSVEYPTVVLSVGGFSALGFLSTQNRNRARHSAAFPFAAHVTDVLGVWSLECKYEHILH